MPLPTTPDPTLSLYKEKFLAAKEGWSVHPPSSGQLLLSRRVRSGGSSTEPGCLFNGRLDVFVHVYSTWIDNVSSFHRTVEFEVVGEYSPSQWTTLKLYGMSWDEGFSRRHEYIENLLVAWDALCRAGSGSRGSEGA